MNETLQMWAKMSDKLDFFQSTSGIVEFLSLFGAFLHIFKCEFYITIGHTNRLIYKVHITHKIHSSHTNYTDYIANKCLCCLCSWYANCELCVYYVCNLWKLNFSAWSTFNDNPQYTLVPFSNLFCSVNALHLLYLIA